VIVGIMLMNLRGVRDTRKLFVVPTYFFILSVFALVAKGLWSAWTGQVPERQPLLSETYPLVPLIVVFRAFASGCSAMTGVETISNAVRLFQPPAQKNAKTTITIMAITLATMFLGITALTQIYGVVPGQNQTLISLLGRAVYGETAAYYLLQAATALVLFTAANSAYSSFPRLASVLAFDRFLPRQLASVGDRLVYSNSIFGLSVCAAVLVIYFHGNTLQLIPLYALGVFISITLSQAGMVVHRLRSSGQGRGRGIFLSGLGALTTFLVLVDIASTKFLQGAWVVLLAIALIVFLFREIHEHYLCVGRELALNPKNAPANIRKIKHTVIIPVSGIHRGVLEAVEYATAISDDIRACYVELDSNASARMKEEWKRWLPRVPFVVLKSPYRSVVQPLLRYIDDVEQVAHDDLVTIVVPEFITARWWHQLLHNHTAIFIRAALAFKRRKVVTSVRYHLRKN
jgi:amino acid transporter